MTEYRRYTHTTINSSLHREDYTYHHQLKSNIEKDDKGRIYPANLPLIWIKIKQGQRPKGHIYQQEKEQHPLTQFSVYKLTLFIQKLGTKDVVYSVVDSDMQRLLYP